ncbi:hypothetical protein F2Q69_00056994 [Brassica cretica]|uniref:Uncharacterized protein n=1 Tax=Brassica cretica TaxID=69181 RepID=A0A8S9MPR7_BRACR|nr:hypothetical protein F2Q69_00056994 [Brassica cretica]
MAPQSLHHNSLTFRSVSDLSSSSPSRHALPSTVAAITPKQDLFAQFKDVMFQENVLKVHYDLAVTREQTIHST